MPLTTSSHSQSAVVDRRIRIKAVNLAAGGGTLLAEAGTASTLGGAITGVGAWTKAGPGTLTLTGANTYSGGTTVSAGTLQLGNGGTAGGITGKLSHICLPPTVTRK